MKPYVARPQGMPIPLAAEINFALKKFRELPEEKRRELAKAILEHPTNSKPFADAGIEVYKLLLDADGEERARYINDVICGGDQLFDFHLVTGEHSHKAARLTHFMRDNLVVDDSGCDLPEIAIMQG